MYQVLARKYRPRNFAQLVGQTHVSKALSSALERGRLHHAYLFTGTRGVGKTTIARILAKCLNCETGVTATPCEQCSICQAVNEGRFIDLIEIDAASRTRVEDTRELLDNVPYAPTQGRYKVYLIDEVHMLSTHSFNALLKTLEEPPEHVKFLFATTDPQKLPITIISRCLQFTLRPLTRQEIFAHLDQVLTIEAINHQEQALWQLAESAQGSLRDALSLTDQAIAYGQGQVNYTDVKEMLGLIDKSLVADLLLAIHQQQKQQLADILFTMRQQAIDVMHVLEQLISCLHEVALLQVLASPTQVEPQAQLQQKMQLAHTISSQDVQLYYQIALQGRADLAMALTPEQGFEMCVLRLLAFRPLPEGEYQSDSQQAKKTFVQSEQAPIALSTQTTAIPDEQQAIPAEPVHTQVNIDESIDLAPAVNLAAEHTAPIANPANGTDNALAESDDILQETTSCQPPLSHVTDAALQAPAADDSMGAIIATDELLSEPSPSNQHSTPVVEQMEVLAVEPVFTAEPQVTVAQNLTEVTDPRELLNPPAQPLNGAWSLEKWDYWLRQADLSPAVKEIIQNGIMLGDIAGESTLLIDPSYKRLIEGFHDTLQVALRQLSSANKVALKFDQVSSTTPIQLQQQRKIHAYQTAEQMILQDAAVQGLVTELSAHIDELKLT